MNIFQEKRFWFSQNKKSHYIQLLPPIEGVVLALVHPLFSALAGWQMKFHLVHDPIGVYHEIYIKGLPAVFFYHPHDPHDLLWIVNFHHQKFLESPLHLSFQPLLFLFLERLKMLLPHLISGPASAVKKVKKVLHCNFKENLIQHIIKIDNIFFLLQNKWLLSHATSMQHVA